MTSTDHQDSPIIEMGNLESTSSAILRPCSEAIQDQIDWERETSEAMKLTQPDETSTESLDWDGFEESRRAESNL